MDYRKRKLTSFLCVESKKVHIIGIWGMGGIGKTTIARAVYEEIAHKFEARCFLENVREQSKNNIVHLQKQLLSRITKTNIDDIEDLDSFSVGAFLKKKLRNLLVLIVLDDLDDKEQLESLAGSHDWFGEGSKIIITTRNKEVLEGTVDEIYEENGLSNHESLKLFSLHAFKQTNPREGFMELSQQVINYTRGNPLALRVLGSFLYGKTRNEWESALEILKLEPHDKIYQVLKISFDGLLEGVKDVFLDVACFLKGKDLNVAIEILKSCGYFPELAFKILIDHCLMDKSFPRLWMHDLIQEMGWEIVRRQSTKKLGKRSRLWQYKDVNHVLATNTGTEKIEGIALDSTDPENVCINHSSFSNMHGLRLLIFKKVNIFQDSCQGLETLPSELKYMYWQAYPFDCLPPGLYMKSLVVIEMPRSRIKQLWMGTQCPVQLNVLNLRDSKCLTSIPDLSRAANLESLILNDCTSLIKLHSSVGCLKKLKILNMEGCTKLRSFPVCKSLCLLETLTLSGCKNLKKLPENIGCLKKLKFLNMEGCTKLRSFPACKSLHSLETLTLSRCKNLKKLPENIGHLEKLKFLNVEGCTKLQSFPACKSLYSLETFILSGCKNIKKLPENIGNIKSLKTLNFGGTAITEVPSSIAHSSNLENLSLAGCKRLLACSLNFHSHSIKHLDVSNCGLTDITNSIGCLFNLRYLSLNGNNFRSIPESIGQLSSLRRLYLMKGKELQSLPLLPGNMVEVDASDCTSLEGMSPHLFHDSTGLELDRMYSGYVRFLLSNCPRMAWLTKGSFLLEAVQSFILAQAKFREGCTYQCNVTKLSLCFPGDDVPNWFSHCSFEETVTVYLPSGFLANPSNGFAICALINVRPRPSTSVIGAQPSTSNICCNISAPGNHRQDNSQFWWSCSDRNGPVLFGYISCSDIPFISKNASTLVFHFHGDREVISCGVHLIGVQHKSDMSRLLATASFGSNAETAHVPSLDGEFITLFGSKIKRPRDGLICSNAEMSKDDNYDKEPAAKRSKELNLSLGL